MLYFTKALKMNKERYQSQYTSLTITRGSALEKIVRDFFSSTLSGVHVMVVCTDHPNQLMSAEDFLAKLQQFDWEAALIPQQGGIPENVNRLCDRLPDCESISQILQEISNLIERVVDERFIQMGVNAMIQNCAAREIPDNGLAREEPEHIWTRITAQNLTNLLDANAMMDELRVPNIRILIALSARFFDTFANEYCFFPEFLEYIVLGRLAEDVIAEEEEALYAKKRAWREEQLAWRKERVGEIPELGDKSIDAAGTDLHFDE